MKPFKRGPHYRIDLRRRGFPRIQISTGTSNRAHATAMANTLLILLDAGRRDLVGLLAEQRVTLSDIHEAYLRSPEALEQLKARAESPTLGPLVDEWLNYLESPAGVSPRTKRRYAPQTIRRYRVSWEGFFEHLQLGRDSKLSHITSGFVADYRRARVKAEGGSSRHTRKDGTPPSAATVNRDLVALAAFLRWCREQKGIQFDAPKVVREREPRGRERWLSSDEIRAVEEAAEPFWWPLFATLLHTGMRVGEAQGLVWGDVRIAERRISIHEGARRVKSASSVRDVPISEPLAEILAQQAAQYASGPPDPVFPPPQDRYDRVRDAWRRACLKAGLHDGGVKPVPNATLHDLRHTFGVHAAQAGVPIPRLQRLFGHTTPLMTLRYMKHAPESYFREDAASIAASITGQHDDEREIRAETARKALKRA